MPRPGGRREKERLHWGRGCWNLAARQRVLRSLCIETSEKKRGGGGLEGAEKDTGRGGGGKERMLGGRLEEDSRRGGDAKGMKRGRRLGVPCVGEGRV